MKPLTRCGQNDEEADRQEADERHPSAGIEDGQHHEEPLLFTWTLNRLSSLTNSFFQPLPTSASLCVCLLANSCFVC